MQFKLKDEFIKLDQLLKACDVVYSGGQAKEYLATHQVLVNGEEENRRGKKIRVGDVVETEDLRIEIQ
ncbi:MAG: S4 domain-containing protein YaaA [Firmicutes bacterium]|nr:S4 domain-containing protein YaaA [Bacillota bacterium]